MSEIEKKELRLLEPSKVTMSLRVKEKTRERINEVIVSNNIDYVNDNALLEEVIRVASENKIEVVTEKVNILESEEYVSLKQRFEEMALLFDACKNELEQANEATLSALNDRDNANNILEQNKMFYSIDNNKIVIPVHKKEKLLLYNIARRVYCLESNDAVTEHHIQDLVFKKVFMGYQKYGIDTIGIMSLGEHNIKKFYDSIK
ncbi:MAG: hypothetical protein WC451_05580 [Patescibacteria group bacterium]|jgi:hypothetical protein